ncbi:MAG: uracil-DNA glycosylase [Campylobacterota bacterium]
MTNSKKQKLLKHLYFLKSIGYKFHEPLNLLANDTNNLKLPNDIFSLKNSVSNCYLCELSKTRKKTVFGEGNINSNIMFISDCPGSLEDETGRVFVGRSGELLTKMIENVLNIKREDTYYANILKCKPGENINESCLNLCKAYLLKQIELVRPKIIVTLGQVAYQHLTNDDTSLSKIRGQSINYKDIVLFPTFHPSFLLRNPSSKKDAYVDMLKIKYLMES